MTLSPDALRSSADTLIEAAGDAIDWTNVARESSPRLERESDSLIERLRRARNLCRRLSKATERPMAVGFFGLSQAGKSYLISSLARGENGKLETVLDGEELDFIDHINPPGGGKEATGLVTRFTRTPVATAPGFPVQLALLSEADVVKILGNSFFSDFDHEKVAFDPNAEALRTLLNALGACRQSERQGGLTEDDMVDIRDYFDKRFRKSMEALPADYWLVARDLAPYLSAADRAKLFAPLWGGFQEFANAYLLLQKALESLSFAPIVNAPIAALAQREGGQYVQTSSIMNVDAVRLRFGQDTDDTVLVAPVIDGAYAPALPVPRSIIAALTREMVCVLSRKPRADLLERVDLLDFPGYRGRVGLGSVSEAATEDKGSNPMGALFLRGKVACLFERYTDDQEMNVLVLCNASNEQINITDLGPVLDSWVWATQGRNSSERARRPPGLLYALTKLDIRLSANLNQTENNLDMSWSGMIDTVLLERFGKNEWVRRAVFAGEIPRK
ncbi:hypothetical protein FACS1894205_6730 [Alphaproteobacteria bacterium]|nr:hypothetical protein FACS1894205_6730 [Alphaproteobacteria bacterium]